MQAQIAEDRPPYVTFEYVPEEDRAASIEAGHYVAVDVAYAVITPAGSKDRIFRKVSEWFEHLEQQVTAQRFPRPWLTNFREQYEHWRKGNEIPPNGTPVTRWPAASPAQVKALQQAHILTVEDLAAANEESLARIGMGGRDLKRQAQEWLSASADVGRVAGEVAALRQQNEELAARNEKLHQDLQFLAEQLSKLAPEQSSPPVAAAHNTAEGLLDEEPAPRPTPVRPAARRL